MFEYRRNYSIWLVWRGLINNSYRLTTKLLSYTTHREKDVWVFGEWFGTRCSDNCFYFVDYLAKHYPKLKLFWIKKKGAKLLGLPTSVTILEQDTKETLGILKKAGAVFVNEGIEDLSSKGNLYCSGAVVINLWHGSGVFKKIFGDSISTKSLLKYYYYWYMLLLTRAEYTIAQSEPQVAMWKRCLKTSSEKILKVGQPRCMIFYDKYAMADAREKIFSMLDTIVGHKIDRKMKIISYMPTFRDNIKNAFSFDQIANDSRLNEILTRYNAIIVQKEHFVTIERGEAKSKRSNSIISLKDALPQELLAATDILITDYSSVFWDFLLLNRPIIWFVYDYDYYVTKDRGLYCPLSEIACGDIAYTMKELFHFLEDNIRDPFKDREKRLQRCKEYLTFEGPNASEEICRFVYNKLKLDPAKLM